ncbi:MAG: hypothetical protein J6Y12_01310 [Lachnospiraceae bacterium]|nr:hypothetical protein [Lachnospiraceae bacterium]
MATLREDTKAEWDKMKERPFKDKLSYFWEYYKVHTIVAVIAVIFVVAMIRSFVTSKDYAVYIAAVDSLDASGEIKDVWAGELADIIGFDKDDYEVYIDSSIQFGTDGTSAQADYVSAQKLTALLTSRSMDIMIADMTVFEQYAQNDCFVDLRDIYTEEELSGMEGLIYYTDAATFADYRSSEMNVYEKQAEYVVDHHDPSSMRDPVPVGFFAGEGTRVGESGMYDHLKDTEEFQGHENEAAFGILKNTERYDNAVTGISYLSGK